MKNNPSTDKEARFFALMDWVRRQYPNDEDIATGAEFYKKLVGQFGFAAKTDFLEDICALIDGQEFIGKKDLQVIGRHAWLDEIRNLVTQDTSPPERDSGIMGIKLHNNAKAVLREMSQITDEGKRISRRRWLIGGTVALAEGNILFWETLRREHENRAVMRIAGLQQVKDLCDKEALYLLLGSRLN